MTLSNKPDSEWSNRDDIIRITLADPTSVKAFISLLKTDQFPEESDEEYNLAMVLELGPRFQCQSVISQAGRKIMDELLQDPSTVFTLY